LSFVIDGRVHDHVVRLEEAKARFAFPMSGDPEQVRVDRGATLLCELTFDPGDARLRTQLTEADAWGRIQAGAALIDTGRPFAVEWVRDAFESEHAWGVRREWAHVLGRAGTSAAATAIAHLVARERDPMVIPALLRAAAQVRDRGVVDAIERRLDAGDLGPTATARAYEALGAQLDDARHGTRLMDAANGQHLLAIAESGAARGLAAIGSERALEALIAYSEPGRFPSRGRPHVAAALGALARHAPTERGLRARRRLEDLLRDPDDRVRKQAALALGVAADRAAIPALTAYATTVSAQERATIERVIRRLAQPEDDRVRALRHTIDDLAERLKKLEDRLRRLEAAQPS
jgi:HEAT repeat protein